MNGFIILLAVLAVLFWIHELWKLLLMKDDEFDGRNDKLIWFIFVFFGSLLGALLFCLWRISRTTNAERSGRTEKFLRQTMTEALEKRENGNKGG